MRPKSCASPIFVLRVQEEERKRISRELHDDVGGALTALHLSLVGIEKLIGPDKALHDKIADAQQLLDQAMVKVHNFSRKLRPALLDEVGLIRALRSYVETFAERSGLEIGFHACPEVERLADESKLVLYRLVQEALTNVAKHAQATRATVYLENLGQAIQLEVSDNGQSFDFQHYMAEKRQERLGLAGAQERVRMVQGTFHVDTQPGQGTTVRACIPCGPLAPGLLSGRRASAPG